MTKIIAGEKAQSDYGHLFDRVLPDLQGYDEIHIITKEDLENLKLPRKASPKDYAFEEVAPLLKDSKLASHLQSSGQQDQQRTLGWALAMAALVMESPHSLSFETKNGDKPFRVGFLLMAEEDKEKFYQDITIPRKLSSKDRQDISFTKAPSYFGAVRDFTFLHEVGHLLENERRGILLLKTAIPHLSQNAVFLTEQPNEMAADRYASEKVTANDPNDPVGRMLRQRTLSGTWYLVTRPDEHFTEPFLKGGKLENVPMVEVLAAGKKIAAVAAIEEGKIFQEKMAQVPKGSLWDANREDFAAYCSKRAEKSGKASRNTKGSQNSAVSDAFFECAGGYFDYQVQVLSASRYHFEAGSLERRILDHYVDTVIANGFGAKLQEPPSTKPKADAKVDSVLVP